MIRFWTWVKHFAQCRLGETPDSLRVGPYEITVDWPNGMIFARHLGDPEQTRQCVGRL